MKRYGYVAMLIIVLAMGIAALSAGKSDRYTDLSPEEAFQFIKEHPEAVILDVRSPSEQARGVIPGAILTSPRQVAAGQVKLPPSGPVLLYCRTGRRSSNAADVLAREGRDELYNLSGGLNDWMRSGLPVETPMQDLKQPWFND